MSERGRKIHNTSPFKMQISAERIRAIRSDLPIRLFADMPQISKSQYFREGRPPAVFKGQGKRPNARMSHFVFDLAMNELTTKSDLCLMSLSKQNRARRANIHDIPELGGIFFFARIWPLVSRFPTLRRCCTVVSFIDTDQEDLLIARNPGKQDYK